MGSQESSASRRRRHRSLGTLLVFLYVRGADTRADQRYDAVQVLQAVKPIAAGETVEAGPGGRQDRVGSVVQAGPPARRADRHRADRRQGGAVTNIYPGEQIISSKFGATGASNGLAIPKGKIAISVNLSDPARVAGFVNPGDKVAIFLKTDGRGAGCTRLLLPKVTGDRRRHDHGHAPPRRRTRAARRPPSSCPRPCSPSRSTRQDAEKVLFAGPRRARVRPAQRRLARSGPSRASPTRTSSADLFR